jgi:hypothetical protein
MRKIIIIAMVAIATFLLFDFENIEDKLEVLSDVSEELFVISMMAILASLSLFINKAFDEKNRYEILEKELEDYQERLKELVTRNIYQISPTPEALALQKELEMIEQQIEKLKGEYHGI